jgi:multicomponent K+:H+ antiporter subunit E
MRRVLPQPVISLMILGLWIAIAPAPSLGQFLLGGAIALAIPWFTHPFWPEAPRLARPGVAVRLFLQVLWDIVVANVEVARLVLGPSDRLHPAFIELPLEIEDPFVATVLASIITLTPGTLSVDIDRERRVLLVHALDVTDVPAAIDTIKRRYEAPLREIFGC